MSENYTADDPVMRALLEERKLLRRIVRVANGQLESMYAPLSGFAAIGDDEDTLRVLNAALREDR